MGLGPKLDSVLERIGLSMTEIEQRLEYLNWGEDDARQLNGHASELDLCHRQFIDRLYDHLDHFPHLAAILADPATLERLKRSQFEYYRQLWDAPQSADYVRDRLRIGLVHQQVGVELKWYLGAYRLYLEHMLDELLGDAPEAASFSSLLKRVFFDMSLAIDTYGAAQRQALEDSEARFARALRGANDGIWDWDLGNDRLYVSERWARMLGLSRDNLGESSTSWFARVHPDDLPGLRQAIDAHLRGSSPLLNHEYRIRQRDGGYLWVQARGVITDGRMAGSQTDISQRKASEHQLSHAARHDPLTGLAKLPRWSGAWPTLRSNWPSTPRRWPMPWPAAARPRSCSSARPSRWPTPCTNSRRACRRWHATRSTVPWLRSAASASPSPAMTTCAAPVASSPSWRPACARPAPPSSSSRRTARRSRGCWR